MACLLLSACASQTAVAPVRTTTRVAPTATQTAVLEIGASESPRAALVVTGAATAAPTAAPSAAAPSPSPTPPPTVAPTPAFTVVPVPPVNQPGPTWTPVPNPKLPAGTNGCVPQAASPGSRGTRDCIARGLPPGTKVVVSTSGAGGRYLITWLPDVDPNGNVPFPWSQPQTGTTSFTVSAGGVTVTFDTTF